MRSEFTVPFPVDDSLSSWISKAFPGSRVSGSGRSVSHHPKLHIERMIAEEFIYSKMGNNVVDIGGSVNRHRIFQRKIWSCVPPLTAQDKNRQSRFEDVRDGVIYPRKDWCDHVVQKCTCVENPTFMGVHSFYYLNPRDVLDLAMRTQGPILFAVHDFRAQSGIMYDGEGTWTRRGDKVYMTVQGCNFGYHHSSMPWLHEGSYSRMFSGQVVFTLMKSFGYTNVYSAVYSSIILPSDPMPPPSVELWHMAVKERNAMALAPLPNGKMVPLCLLNVLYQEAFIHLKESPRALESLLYSKATSTLRTWQSLVNIHEVNSVMTNSVEWVLLTHEDLKKQTRESLIRARRKVICGLGAIEISPRKLVPWMRASISNLFAPKWVRCAPMPAIVEGREDMVVREVERQPLDMAAAYITTKTEPYQGVESIGSTEPTTAWCMKSEGRSDEDKVSKITLEGIVPVMDTPPVIFNQSLQNMLDSLNRRAYAEPLPIDDCVFSEFERFIDEDLNRLFGKARRVGSFQPTPFEEWNGEARFPPAKREKHRVAKENSPLTLSKLDCEIRDSFLKQEVSIGNKDKAARMISASRDQFKVAVGPYLHRISKLLGSILCKHTIYAPGKTVSEMGKFYDPVLSSECTDMSKFDSCVTSRHMRAMLTVYKHFGFPERIQMYLLWSIPQLLVFRNGLTARPEMPRRTSGHPNTTFENTLLNIFMHRFAVYRAYGPKALKDMTIMAGGDDIIMQHVPGTQYVAVLRQLGMQPKAVTCPPGLGEFYSGIFVPTKNGVILTPMFHKFLAKFGMHPGARKAKPLLWLKGVVKGNQAVFAHVPWMLRLLEVMDNKIGVVDGVVVPTCGYNFQDSDWNKFPDNGPDLSCDQFTADYYGLTVSDLYGIVESYRTAPLRSSVSHPALAQMMALLIA